MSIIAACACGQRVQVNDALAGRQVKCPKCSGPITIPTTGASPTADPLAGFAAPATAPQQTWQAAPGQFGAAPQAAYAHPPYGQQQPVPQNQWPQQYPQQYGPQQYAPAQPYQQPYGAPYAAGYSNPYAAPAAGAGAGQGQLTPELRKRYSLLSLALGVPGLILYAGSGFLARFSAQGGGSALAVVGLLTLLIGIVLVGAGLAYSAMYKGYSPFLGLLGFLGCIGLFVIAILPDKGAKMVQFGPPPPWPPR